MTTKCEVCLAKAAALPSASQLLCSVLQGEGANCQQEHHTDDDENVTNTSTSATSITLIYFVDDHIELWFPG